MDASVSTVMKERRMNERMMKEGIVMDRRTMIRHHPEDDFDHNIIVWWR